jgi:endonuclease I
MDWSREHTYPHSWMPSFPANNPEKPEYNDQHNLYPARQTNVNALRCNYPLGDVLTASTSYNGCKLGTDAAGNKVFEPRSAHKGRAARAIMYMATCYHSSATSWAFPNPIGNCSGTPINYGQDQYTLKKWHFENPPTNFDIARNDFLDSVQTNRNPFVDSIRYACFIDFTNMGLWQPAIVQIGTELQTEQGITTQWYLNGTPISGATSQSFSPTVNGTYTVKLKQFAPCPEIESKQLIVTNLGVENSGKTNANMSIFPNPNKGEYTLSIEAPKAGKAIVSIIDVGGRAIISGNYNLTEGVNQILMNHTLSVGTYFLKIESNTLNQIEIFVVQ